ncbi:MAG: hypothetical protein RIE08_02070 [Acidimicrobiales bacterium]
MLTLLILIIIVVLWAAVLVPPWLRRRDSRPSSRSDSRAGFQNQLSKLGGPAMRRGQAPNAQVLPIRPAARPTPSQFGGAPPGHSLVARADVERSRQAMVQVSMSDGQSPRHLVLSRAQARRRRRNILFVLMALAGVTFLAAVAAQGIFLVLHLFADLALIGYVTLLVQHQRQAEEKRAKVRPIRPAGEPIGEPVPAYRPQLRSAN